jgi:hypothetical protein
LFQVFSCRWIADLGPPLVGVSVDKIQVLLIRVTSQQPPLQPVASTPGVTSASPPLLLQPPVQPMNNATAVIPAPPGGLSAGVIGGIISGGVVFIGEVLILCCNFIKRGN